MSGVSDSYDKYGHRVVRDEIGGFAGPLAGGRKIDAGYAALKVVEVMR